MLDEQGPHVRPPTTPPRSPAMPVIALALLGSIVVNGLIAVRYREAADEVRILQARVEQQQQQLDQVRGRLRGDEDDSPMGLLAKAVAQLRGLPFEQPVRPTLLSAASLRDRIERSFRQDNVRKEVEASEDVLRALGLIGDIDLYETLRDAQGEQIAGFYDSESDELVVGAADANALTPYDRVVLAHEYTHALTDQHFDLGRLDRLREDGKEEAAAALLALVEGDAQYVMSIYRDQILTREEYEDLARAAQAIDQSSFERLPPFLQEAFTFPYEEGLQFVSALFRQGGHALVDDAYRDPPVSTEQIMHPERFTRADRDQPVSVSLPNLARAMGGGWRTLEEGDIGELDLKLLADTSIGRNLGGGESAAAAEGWDGGRYVGVRSRAGTVVALKTAWDSATEAREATRAFGRWLEARYPDGRLQEAGPGGRGWGSETGSGVVVRSEDEMILIVGPDPATVSRAREALTRG